MQSYSERRRLHYESVGAVYDRSNQARLNQDRLDRAVADGTYIFSPVEGCCRNQDRFNQDRLDRAVADGTYTFSPVKELVVDMDASSMIHIPSGPFLMGSDDHGKQERPRHRVSTDAYEIAAATVRRWEYALFVEQTGHEEPRGWYDPAFADPNQPVVGVNWFDATAYCSWLSRSGGREYRLPTEAEWEKACKGGDDTAIYSWGEQAPGGIAYYQGEWTAPRPAGERPPNGYGLYNMGDNVHEWCLDWYGADYYRISDRPNPEGPPTGKRRVSRGGSWRHAVKASRAAHRSSLPPDFRYTDYGIRIAHDSN